MLNLHSKSAFIWIDVIEALRKGGIEVPDGFWFPDLDEKDACDDKRLMVEQMVDMLIKNHARIQVINILRDLFLD